MSVVQLQVTRALQLLQATLQRLQLRGRARPHAATGHGHCQYHGGPSEGGDLGEISDHLYIIDFTN